LRKAETEKIEIGDLKLQAKKNRRTMSVGGWLEGAVFSFTRALRFRRSCGTKNKTHKRKRGGLASIEM
jgi:hypothetical protein